VRVASFFVYLLDKRSFILAYNFIKKVITDYNLFEPLYPTANLELELGGTIMEIKIVKDLDNKLLNRKELDFTVEYEGPTPSRANVRKKLAALLNKDLDLVLIQKMESEYGHQLAKGYAKIYESEERMKQIEAEHILLRNTMPEEPVVEEAAEGEAAEDEAAEDEAGEAEESAEEAPAEEAEAAEAEEEAE
jgi:small subunit ribosomal protein S24e